MAIDQIVEQLRNMEEEELQQISRLIDAKKRTYQQPLAFLQEVMGFCVLPKTGETFMYRMTIGDDLLNRYGIVHGGVLTTFIDTAMAETAFQLDGHLKRAVTLNLTVNFVKAAVEGRLRCGITARQNSHKLALFAAEIHDDQDDVVATATGHFYKTAHAESAPAEVPPAGQA